jgi:hypothetical protein
MQNRLPVAVATAATALALCLLVTSNIRVRRQPSELLELAEYDAVPVSENIFVGA